MWKLAPSLITLRDQINKKWPERLKTDDGTIGDTAHQARKSEHNPDPDGTVRALDITNDPFHGVSSEDIANGLRTSKDPRILYVISNRKIASAKDNWTWRPYDGANPHNKHFHISVQPEESLRDDPGLWDAIGDVRTKIAAGMAAPGLPKLRFGMQGDSVKVLQRLLQLPETGVFDATTENSVKKFQLFKQLVNDGIVGSYTWESLVGNPASP